LSGGHFVSFLDELRGYQPHIDELVKLRVSLAIPGESPSYAGVKQMHWFMFRSAVDRRSTLHPKMFKPMYYSPACVKSHTHLLQVRRDEVPNLIQVFQVVSFATLHMGNMAVPDTTCTCFNCVFNPDLDDERLGS